MTSRKPNSSQLDSRATDLDQQLVEADRRLARTSSLNGIADGALIRQRVGHRYIARQNRNRTLLAASLVGLMLVGWRFMMPSGSLPEVAQEVSQTENWHESQTNKVVSAETLKSELKQLQDRQDQLQLELEILRVKAQIGNARFNLERQTRFELTNEETFQLNRNTWNTLQRIADCSGARVADKDRWKLEFLAGSFPDTSAGAAARQMLETNNIPDSLRKPDYEL